MGYRSDVTLILYADTEYSFPMLKLWVEENLKPVLDEHNLGDLETFTRHSRWNNTEYKGYVWSCNNVKWYESYSDVAAFTAVWEKFKETFTDGDGESEGKCQLGGEFCRLGEEVEDVELDTSYHAANLITINRSVDF